MSGSGSTSSQAKGRAEYCASDDNKTGGIKYCCIQEFLEPQEFLGPRNTWFSNNSWYPINSWDQGKGARALVLQDCGADTVATTSFSGVWACLGSSTSIRHLHPRTKVWQCWQVMLQGMVCDPAQSWPIFLCNFSCSKWPVEW